MMGEWLTAIDSRYWLRCHAREMIPQFWSGCYFRETRGSGRCPFLEYGNGRTCLETPLPVQCGRPISPASSCRKLHPHIQSILFLLGNSSSHQHHHILPFIKHNIRYEASPCLIYVMPQTLCPCLSMGPATTTRTASACAVARVNSA